MSDNVALVHLEWWAMNERDRITRFAKWYREQHAAHPDQNWPWTTTPAEWDEMYLGFSDPDRPPEG